jgi:NAD+ kinase
MLRLRSGNNEFEELNYALNDITIQKHDTVMISVDAYLDQEFLNTYWTDGLIISTPTGSTAYSLSVGGPILTPDSATFVLAPIASHNLSVRPLVITDTKEIRLEVNSRSGKFLLTADNRSILLGKEHNIISITRAPFCLRMIKLPFNNFYSTIRNKLLWGADKRN